MTNGQTPCQKELRAERDWVLGARKSAPYVAIGSRRKSLHKEEGALARARRREKCCWELRGGVRQKPSHLTTCAGWKTNPPRVIGDG